MLDNKKSLCYNRNCPETNHSRGACITLSETVSYNRQKVNLRDISRRDKIWDTKKAKADIVSQLYIKYGNSPRDTSRAQRLKECAGFLTFGRSIEDNSLHLIRAHFCRNWKACPICQWRRSLMYKARFYNNMPQIMANNPKARYIFLTLTIENCLLSELRKTIQLMNKAFSNMTKLVFFKENFIGYCRNIEVTKANDGKAHPHMHILLMANPNYFSGKNYKSKIQWQMIWKQCLKVNYNPVLDIRTPDSKKTIEQNVKELLKYPVKESDMELDTKWFYEYCEQVHKLRFISTGGILKDIVKETQQTDEELINVNDEHIKAQVSEILDFKWYRKVKHYKRVF